MCYKEMDVNESYRTIPKVDTVLNESVIKGLPYSAGLIKRAVVDALEKIRGSIGKGHIQKSPEAPQIAASVAQEITFVMESGLTDVINAAGVIVYTNLGRAPLAKSAIDAMVQSAAGYSDLEYDLEHGARGSRQNHIRPVTRYCFGAEDALVVNNNAAAVLLILSTLAKDKEVIVSRGELVEIGGSFRMPDVMSMSNAVMREVGTTNKTNISDYRNAINDNTALIMKVHRSNFSIVGFTDEVEIRELSGLAREIGIPLYVDMGSGIPFDLSPYGITNEWTIPSCLNQGADIVSFSGDKALGGPQAGIILGKTAFIEPMAKNPLHRALRADKLCIAALSSTLCLLSRGDYKDIPVLRMITEPIDDVKKRAQMLSGLIKSIETEIIPTQAIIGGGSSPAKGFSSAGVVVKTKNATDIHARLRRGSPAVVPRIEQDRLIFDMKTVDELQIETLARRINEATSDGI